MKRMIDIVSEPAKSPKEMDGVDLSNELIDAIDLHIGQSEGKPIEKKREALAPSDANSCVRRVVYVLRGTTLYPTFSSLVYRIFANGNALHARYTEYFRGMGILLEEEPEVTYDDPPVRGFVDAIIDFHGPKVVELKSISKSGFEKVKAFHRPKPEHVKQIQLYFLCTDIDSGFIFYECKNTQQMLPIYVERDDVLINKILNKYAILVNTYKEGKLPARPYKESSSRCKECDVRQQCWSDTDDGEEIPGL